MTGSGASEQRTDRFTGMPRWRILRRDAHSPIMMAITAAQQSHEKPSVNENASGHSLWLLSNAFFAR